MKETIIERSSAGAAPAFLAHTERFQIFRQARAGNFMPEFRTNYAPKAVEMFSIMAPAFDGGEIRMWDQREQRTCASVHWDTEKMEFGFLVHHRTNVFHDPLLGLIARRLHEREEIRSEVHHGLRMTA